ncbi:MAG TPA: XrtA/PEP-CTERM system TPR-repeat protein PrsT [Rhodocyclaceae bacterium]|nr:XrtA/PEP-CTERM system TPR-repeat protein PrsT [Rhodocyclaceae bacterium]
MTQAYSVRRIQRLAQVCAIGMLLVLTACNSNNPAKLIQSAKTAMAKRDFNTAAIQIKNVLQKDSENPEARFLFGQILLAQHDSAGAARELHKALDAGYSEEAIIPVLTQTLVDSGSAKQAIDEFGAKQLKAPLAEAALETELGRAYMAQDDVAKAGERFDAALKLQPDNVAAQLGLAQIKLRAADADTAMAITNKILVQHPDSLEAMMAKGDLLLSQGKIDDALAVFKSAVKIKSDDQRLLGRLATVQVGRGSLADAEQSLAALKKVAPNTVQTTYTEGLLALREKKWITARDDAAKVLRTVPNHGLSLVLAATANMRLGDNLQAQTMLQQAIAAQKDWAAPRKLLVESYIASRDADSALDALKPLLTPDKQDSEVLNLAGQAYLLKGDYVRSTDYFSRLATANPSNAIVRTSLGMARMQAGDDVRAMQDLEAATKLDTNSDQAELAIISAYLRKGETDKALAAIATLEQRHPDNPLTYDIKGQALIVAKKLPDARAAFEHALQLQPGDIGAAVQLARMDVADQKLDDAKKRFEHMIEKEPKNIRAYVLLAELQAESGANPKDVQATLDKAVNADPTVNIARLALVQFYLRTGDAKQALATAQQAQAAQPDALEVLSVLGRTQLAAGDPQQAVATFSKLQNLQPQSPTALVELADAQRAAGDKDATEKTLRRALDMAPDLADAQQRLVALLLEDKREADALQVAKDMQKSKPNSVVGYALEADVQSAGKHWPETVNALQQAYQRAKSPQIVIGLYEAYMMEGKQADAQRIAAEWLKANPKDAVVHNYLGERAMTAKQYPEAISQYKAVLAVQPNSIPVLNNLAWVANKAGDPKAIDYAEAALKAAPRVPQVMETVGTIFVEHNQAQRGLDLLKQASAMAPKAAEIHLGYARALASTGDKAAAKKELSAATDAAAGNASLKRDIDDLAKSL